MSNLERDSYNKYKSCCKSQLAATYCTSALTSKGKIFDIQLVPPVTAVPPITHKTDCTKKQKKKQQYHSAPVSYDQNE